MEKSKDKVYDFWCFINYIIRNNISYIILIEGTKCSLFFDYNSNNVSDRNITINYGVSAKDARYEISTPFGASKTYTTSLIYDETLNGYSGYVDSITDTEFSHTGNVTEKTTDYNAYIGGINFEEFEKYSYDEAGRISSSLTGALNDDGTIYGNVTHYTYDKTRLSKVQLNGSQIKNTDSTVNAQYEFYADGKLKSITYPALSTGEILKSEYVYNSLGWLQLLTNKKGEVSVSSFAYEYDSNGNILKITETVGEETNVTNLTYDKLNRIKTVSGTKQADSYYEYDAYGNRKIDYQKQDFLSEESATYTYNELNQLESTTVGTDTTNFEYGADGMRFLKQENNNLPTFYVYNLDGKLSEEVQFVTRTSSEETDYVMYSTASYIHGPDRTLAKLDNLQKKSYYYLYNGHGDVIQIIDTDGNIVNTYDYDIWGNFLKKQETIHNPFTYFGQTYDETTGRFTQQDPAEDI